MYGLNTLEIPYTGHQNVVILKVLIIKSESLIMHQYYIRNTKAHPLGII